MTRLDDCATNIVLHDNRLNGNAPSTYADYVYSVDQSTPLMDVFNRIASLSSNTPNGRWSKLFVMCHGYAGEDPYAGMCADVGGFGLQLCTEGLNQTTVCYANAIYNCVDSIIIYSCAAADDSMAAMDENANGKGLMSRLAVNVNCTVIAADRIQWYHIIDPGTGNGEIDFGAWEGNVFQFNPDGSYAQLPTSC